VTFFDIGGSLLYLQGVQANFLQIAKIAKNRFRKITTSIFLKIFKCKRTCVMSLLEKSLENLFCNVLHADVASVVLE